SAPSRHWDKSPQRCSGVCRPTLLLAICDIPPRNSARWDPCHRSFLTLTWTCDTAGLVAVARFDHIRGRADAGATTACGVEGTYEVSIMSDFDRNVAAADYGRPLTR